MDLRISDKAFHLANQWMRNMSGGDNLDSEDTKELEVLVDGRPAGLGLGAECTHHSQLTTTLNPIEKKLKAKLDTSKRAAYCQESKRSRDHGNINKSTKIDKEDTDSDNEDAGRAAQFHRKQRSSTFISHLEPSKHKKKKK